MALLDGPQGGQGSELPALQLSFGSNWHRSDTRELLNAHHVLCCAVMEHQGHRGRQHSIYEGQGPLHHAGTTPLQLQKGFIQGTLLADGPARVARNDQRPVACRWLARSRGSCNGQAYLNFSIIYTVEQ